MALSKQMATSSSPNTNISENSSLVHIGRLWNQLLLKLHHVRFPSFGRRRIVFLNMPPDLVVDAFDLPGDAPSDMPRVLSTFSCITDKTEIRWCLVGDILLIYYNVPKIMADIEICVPFEDLHKVREVFNTEFNFCSPFRPGRAYYDQHLARYPRLKVNDVHQCFFLVPDSHYGANSQAFNDIMHLPYIGFPLLPLPHCVRGLAKNVISDSNAHNFRIQLEFLIGGMDIDEEW